jgi:hypothetical protein
MAVIRPGDPAAALAEGKRIAEASKAGTISAEETQAQLDRMLGLQTYAYVGILCADLPKRGEQPKLLNHDFTVIEGDHVKAGDSFTPYEPLMEANSQGEA